MMNKLLIGLLGAGVIATGGYAAASGFDDTAPARTVSLPATTTDGTATTTGTTTTDDIVVGNAPATGVTGTTGEDISGPCDETEHADDPRCTGGAADDDDRSGSNSGSDDDDSNDDRSGSNSGSGSDDDDNDNDD